MRNRINKDIKKAKEKMYINKVFTEVDKTTAVLLQVAKVDEEDLRYVERKDNKI